MYLVLESYYYIYILLHRNFISNYWMQLYLELHSMQKQQHHTVDGQMVPYIHWWYFTWCCMELPSDAEVFSQYKNIQRRQFRHQSLMVLKWVKSGQLYYHLLLMLTFFTAWSELCILSSHRIDSRELTVDTQSSTSSIRKR